MFSSKLGKLSIHAPNRPGTLVSIRGSPGTCVSEPFSETGLDGDIHAGGQIELLELIHGLGVGIDDVEHALVGADLELLHGLLVHVGGAVHGPALDTGGQRDRAFDHGTGVLRRFEDFVAINDKSLEDLVDALRSYSCFSIKGDFLTWWAENSERYSFPEAKGWDYAIEVLNRGKLMVSKSAKENMPVWHELAETYYSENINRYWYYFLSDKNEITEEDITEAICKAIEDK